MTLVVMDDLYFLVDMGVSCRRAATALKEIGVEPEQLSGILITHEHVDHVRGLPVFSRRYHIPLYVNRGTWEGMCRRDDSIDENLVREIVTGEDFFVGQVNVLPFPIPHDAMDPVGFVFGKGSLRCAVATDIGHINDVWMNAVRGCQAMVLESNHDEKMLREGPYPYHLKQRILSRKGHLSNVTCGRVLRDLVHGGLQAVCRAHLSGENNLPELAYAEGARAIEEEGFRVGRDVMLSVARRDSISDMICLEDGKP